MDTDSITGCKAVLIVNYSIGIREALLKGRDMVLGHFFMLMGANLRVSGSWTRRMERRCLLRLMV